MTTWMMRNEDDLVWTTHHEDGGVDNFLTYINICYNGVA